MKLRQLHFPFEAAESDPESGQAAVNCPLQKNEFYVKEIVAVESESDAKSERLQNCILRKVITRTVNPAGLAFNIQKCSKF